MKFLTCMLLLWFGCVAEAFDPGALARIDAAIETAITKTKIPGGVFWLEQNGTNYVKAYGQRVVEPKPEPMHEDAVFDLASLTKVVACTPVVMLLVERGQVSLDEKVSHYIPGFVGYGKDAITIRHLMTHTSGLRGGISTRPPWQGWDTAIKMACAEKVKFKPGTDFRYSDINFFILGDVVQRVSGRALQDFVTSEVYGPLKMSDTCFLPPKVLRSRIAPTTKGLQGSVHDPISRCMGGVAGHAGLFSTASDLARYARMLLDEGEWDGVKVFKPETVRLMTSIQTPKSVSVKRGLGWDIESPYSRLRGGFSAESYGHTGYTGTSIWIDPASKAFWIFLSNRVHPDGTGSVKDLRAVLGVLAAEAL